MKDGTNRVSMDWLFANAGPIIRWRLVRDFDIRLSDPEKTNLLCEALATDEARRWLGNLGKALL